MTIIMTNEELEKIYRFTNNLKSPTANKVFNSVFSTNHRKEFSVKRINAELVELKIDEKVSLNILDVFVDNAFNMKALLSGNPISIISKGKTFLISFLNDLKRAIK